MCLLILCTIYYLWSILRGNAGNILALCTIYYLSSILAGNANIVNFIKLKLFL